MYRDVDYFSGWLVLCIDNFQVWTENRCVEAILVSNMSSDLLNLCFGLILCSLFDAVTASRGSRYRSRSGHSYYNGSSSSSSSSSAGWVVGVAIASVVGLVIVFIAVYVCCYHSGKCKKFRNSKNRLRPANTTQETRVRTISRRIGNEVPKQPTVAFNPEYPPPPPHYDEIYPSAPTYTEMESRPPVTSPPPPYSVT